MIDVSIDGKQISIARCGECPNCDLDVVEEFNQFWLYCKKNGRLIGGPYECGAGEAFDTVPKWCPCWVNKRYNQGLSKKEERTLKRELYAEDCAENQ